MQMKELLNSYPQLREKLYIRGFLLSSGKEDIEDYPFYGTWNALPFGPMRLLVHPLQHAVTEEGDNCRMAIVGHAMNPFTMESDERRILKSCLNALNESEQCFWDCFNQLTGIFTFFVMHHGQFWIMDDASGMQTTFFTVQDGRLYVSSHTMLLGELLGLKKDSYAEQLSSYRFFPLLGNSLPGDRTPFLGLRRITPNTCFIYENGAVKHHRFFEPHILTGKSMEELARQAGDILHSTLALIAEKWERPAISLTGGCDSKTTLACANGLHDRFRYYSYSSSQSEQVDCDAAGEICRALGLQHTIYQIPSSLPESEPVDPIARILRWNSGNILDCNPNDVRKRIVLDRVDDFDVEVKSWASEIGRAYFSKRFHGRTEFLPHPTGRACTTLYKFFLHNRRLVRETDQVFEQFLRDYYQAAKENPIPWFEQFFWEFRVPAWNGLVITGEHRYSSDITIPYNNRLLLTILLSAPIEDRIHDTLYVEIRRQFDPRIDATGVAVTNLLHTEKREKLENLYWVLHAKCPF